MGAGIWLLPETERCGLTGERMGSLEFSPFSRTCGSGASAIGESGDAVISGPMDMKDPEGVGGLPFGLRGPFIQSTQLKRSKTSFQHAFPIEVRHSKPHKWLEVLLYSASLKKILWIFFNCADYSALVFRNSIAKMPES